MPRNMRSGKYLSLSRVNHDIVRSNVSMHDTFAMGKLKSFQKFVDVIPDIITTKSGI